MAIFDPKQSFLIQKREEKKYFENDFIWTASKNWAKKTSIICHVAYLLCKFLNWGQNSHFWSKIGLFCPKNEIKLAIFDPITWEKIFCNGFNWTASKSWAKRTSINFCLAYLLYKFLNWGQHGHFWPQNLKKYFGNSFI